MTTQQTEVPLNKSLNWQEPSPLMFSSVDIMAEFENIMTELDNRRNDFRDKIFIQEDNSILKRIEWIIDVIFQNRYLNENISIQEEINHLKENSWLNEKEISFLISIIYQAFNNFEKKTRKKHANTHKSTFIWLTCDVFKKIKKITLFD